MLCGNTTPELTAYNAYRNENRRIRRAEGLKMYAVGDAYRLYTKCIRTLKEGKREKISLLLLLLYCPFFYLLLPASSGIPQQTVNDFLLPVFADDRLFGLSPPV